MNLCLSTKVAHLCRPPKHFLAQSSSRFGLSRGLTSKRTANGNTEPDAPDLTQKLLHLAWHPESNLIATAASNSLYMFCAA